MADSFLGRSSFTMGQRNAAIGMDIKSYKPPTTTNGTFQRAPRSEKLPNVGDINGEQNLSLMEKLRLHYNSNSNTDYKSRHVFRVLFQFQAVTQLYMTLVYLIPYLFSDFDPMTQYYVKVAACYVFVMGEANWLCSLCYSSNLPDFRDRPNLDFNDWFQNPPEVFGQNGTIKTHIPTVDKNGLEWKYCTKCQRYKPPRSHHCKICKTCILRRDHHCYLIGKCVGHYNQRYFIVFCFLGTVTGSLGLVLSVPYLISLPDPGMWLDYIFPWSLFKLFLGQVSWQFCLLTFHVQMLAVFGLLSTLYGLGQFMLTWLGVTLYEVAKHIDVKVTSSASENLRMVFGDYWGLNFLFPAQILFKQRHDGIHYDSIKFGNSKVSVE